MTKREIMKKAHEIARQMEGHYHARMALGLRLAWREKKEMKERESKTLKLVKWFAQKNHLDSMKYRGKDYTEFEVIELIRE